MRGSGVRIPSAAPANPGLFRPFSYGSHNSRIPMTRGRTKKVAEFIRRRALDAAEMDVTERRIVTIPTKDWKKFKAWANRPAEEIDGLKDLTSKASTWRE